MTSESDFVRELRDATNAAVDKLECDFDERFGKQHEEFVSEIVTKCKLAAENAQDGVIIDCPPWYFTPKLPDHKEKIIKEHIRCLMKEDPRLEGLDIRMFYGLDRRFTISIKW